MMERGKVFRLAAWAGLLAGLFFLVGGSGAAAQFNPNSRPLFGGASLQAGFMPDPHVLSGQLGGPIQASQINSSCRGYISSQPSHTVRTRTGFRNLRFIVSARADATLMVMLPNGAVICNDDGGLRMNPLIETALGRGTVSVWVGAYSSSAVGTPYQIGFSELSHVNADTLGGGAVAMPRQPPPPPPMNGIQPNMAPAFGHVNLQSGFMPDPHILSGTAGGPVSASTVNSGCRGHISPQPSHVLSSGSGFRTIRFIVNSPTDLTLMVMLPNGQIVCDDDGGSSMNPLIATSSQPGPIRIWVGTYSSGRSAQYNIGFSELDSVGTNNIPPPGGGVGPGPVVGVRPPPPPPAAELVAMQASIPVTLVGPGMTGNVIAVWHPRGGPEVQVSLNGRNLMAGGVNIGSVPGSMRDPVVTVTQRRNGNLLVRAEQPPTGGRGDQGEQLLLHIRYAGRPTVQDRWSGTAAQRGPRWSR